MRDHEAGPDGLWREGGAPAMIADGVGDGRLPKDHCVDGVELARLAQRMATPLHVYSASTIRERITNLQAALSGMDALICFAVKANPNVAILRLMAAAGLGADVVSAGELQRSLRAGISPGRIVFSGVGKTAGEIITALDAGIMRFNIESSDELHLLQHLACERGQVARAAARINPDVDAGTHAKISTGRAENKFGVGVDEARSWFSGQAAFPNVRLDGLHLHIGSQILSPAAYAAAFARAAEFAHELRAHGHALATVDVGGGLGVSYRRDQQPIELAAYCRLIREAFAGLDARIIVEPGRCLVADAGMLLTRVVRHKRGAEREFLIVDAAMNDLQRPSLYDAWHDIDVLCEQGREPACYDIVGPVCESADTFARRRGMPRCEAGDLLAIRTTGAYGASMASTYNSRPLAAEVLLENGRCLVIRRRQTIDEMIAAESEATAWFQA